MILPKKERDELSGAVGRENSALIVKLSEENARLKDQVDKCVQDQLDLTKGYGKQLTALEEENAALKAEVARLHEKYDLQRLVQENTRLQQENFGLMQENAALKAQAQRFQGLYDSVSEQRIRFAEENARLSAALDKIRDPRLRHKEPDAYTELGCVMTIADEALSVRKGSKDLSSASEGNEHENE